MVTVVSFCNKSAYHVMSGSSPDLSFHDLALSCGSIIIIAITRYRILAVYNVFFEQNKMADRA